MKYINTNNLIISISSSSIVDTATSGKVMIGSKWGSGSDVVESSCFSITTTWSPWKWISYSNICTSNLNRKCSTTNYGDARRLCLQAFTTFNDTNALLIFYLTSCRNITCEEHLFSIFTFSSAIFTRPLKKNTAKHNSKTHAFHFSRKASLTFFPLCSPPYPTFITLTLTLSLTSLAKLQTSMQFVNQYCQQYRTS